MTVRARLALALCSLLVAVCAQAQLIDAHDRLLEKKAAVARSQGCQWLASQQHPDGSIALAGHQLNPNVWETANALIALLQGR